MSFYLVIGDGFDYNCKLFKTEKEALISAKKYMKNHIQNVSGCNCIRDGQGFTCSGCDEGITIQKIELENIKLRRKHDLWG